MNFNILPISASRLHARSVHHGRHRIRGLSLFPFFDQQGRVHRIVAIPREASEIYVLPSGQTLGRLPVFGRIQVPARGPFLDPIRKADLNELKNLWHYDPRWVLDEERFASHWARRALKSTNCVTRPRKNFVAIFYRSDLSQVTWIVYQEQSGGLSFSRWNEFRLPSRAPRRKSYDSVARQKASLWILDPIWTRK